MHKPCKVILLALLTCYLALTGTALVGTLVYAASLNPNIANYQPSAEQAWNLVAEKLNTRVGGEIVDATGSVELRMGDDYIRADFARYYASTKWIYLSGNIQIKMGKDTLEADEAELSLSQGTGWLVNGKIFLEGSHSYFSGAYVQKHAGDVYSFKKAKITTCDNSSPAWSFEADEAIIEIEGYAQLLGTSFKIKDVPVLYSPYLIVPARNKRQTGLLLPEIGHSSSKGYLYNQPFFWAIDESRDLTINEQYMSTRGFMHGLNYRSQETEDTSLWLRLDWLEDRLSIAQDDQKKDYKGDGLARNNESRFWLRGMYDWKQNPGTIDPAWQFRADLDYTSDQYFLRDFKNGMGGYKNSRTELFDTFSRDLQEEDNQRLSKLMLFREWDRVAIYLSGTYTQDPSYGHGNQSHRFDDSVQSLPTLDAYLHKGRIVEHLPFEVEASAQAGYFYREYGDKGSRLDFAPQFNIPISGKFGSINASASLRSTYYSTQEYNSSRNNHRSADSERFFSNYSFSASTQLQRNFDLGSNQDLQAGESNWTSIQHRITPRLTYRYLDMAKKDDLPEYDYLDLFEGYNEVTLSVESTLSRKREQVLTRKKADSKELESYYSTDYLDFVRIKLSQSYDIKESRRDEDLAPYPKRPFKDLVADVNINLDSYLSFNSRTYWSPNNANLTRHYHWVNLDVADWGSLYTGIDFRGKVDRYDYQRAERDTMLKLGANIQISDNFSANFYYNWSMAGSAKSEKALTLLYHHQCFQIGGEFISDDNEDSFRLVFAFTGLDF